MARRGNVIENPITGERITFLKTAKDTDGKLINVEVDCPPRSKGPLAHVHPRMEERFEVLSGTMGVRLGRGEQRLEKGESVIIPKGIPHTFWNPTDKELRFLAELRPALNTETMLETYFGLARDGKAFKSGIPKNPLQAAVLVREYGADTCPAGLPMPVYRVLLKATTALVTVGRVLGYGARYPDYSGPEEAETMRIEHSVEIGKPLIGHEFRALGHRFHIIESARDTVDGTMVFDYVARGLGVHYPGFGIQVPAKPRPQTLAQFGVQTLPRPVDAPSPEPIVDRLPRWEVSWQ